MATHPDAERLLPLLERDVVRTLGEAHRQLVHTLAARVRELGVEDSGEKLVGDVQQYFHDACIDTTWPACPLHRRHPLWYRDEAWWCDQDGVAVSRLGELERAG